MNIIDNVPIKYSMDTKTLDTAKSLKLEGLIQKIQIIHNKKTENVQITKIEKQDLSTLETQETIQPLINKMIKSVSQYTPKSITCSDQETREKLLNQRREIGKKIKSLEEEFEIKLSSASEGDLLTIIEQIGKLKKDIGSISDSLTESKPTRATIKGSDVVQQKTIEKSLDAGEIQKKHEKKSGLNERIEGIRKQRKTIQNRAEITKKKLIEFEEKRPGALSRIARTIPTGVARLTSLPLTYVATKAIANIIFPNPIAISYLIIGAGIGIITYFSHSKSNQIAEEESLTLSSISNLKGQIERDEIEEETLKKEEVALNDEIMKDTL